MSWKEIIHRIHEQIKRKKDKYHAKRSLLTEKAPLPYLASLRENITLHALPDNQYQAWKATIKAAQEGNFLLLGQVWSNVDKDTKWHLDPVSNSYWEAERYCFDVPYRSNEIKGDVKYVWELNRLQYLQIAAYLAYKEKDESLIAFTLSELMSWITHNPPYQGINWASGIELSMRVVSICIITTLLHEHITPQDTVTILQTLENHGIWLERYPSKYSSANNHATAEGLGLFLLGSLCPAFASAKRWKTKGWDLLCQSCLNPILSDGSGAEQAISYTAFTLEMLMLGLVVAEQGSIPDYYPGRIRMSGEYLRWFTDKGGNQPHIGDNDNARVLGMYMPDERYVNSVLSAIAALTKRADLVPPCPALDLRHFLFGFPPAASENPLGTRSFHEGGYSVGRHIIKEKELLIAFDHGELGYLSIAAHGHADALAFWLHLDDQPVFVDAGTYLYHAGGTWRDYFRSTQAHNTLSINGEDSSIMAGNFNWSKKARAKLVKSDYAKDYWSVTAEHDGYQKRFGVLHQRKVKVGYNGIITLVDSLTGKGSHPVGIGFMLHPDLRVALKESRASIYKGNNLLLTLYCKSHLELSLQAAYYSSTFGDKQITQQLVLKGMLSAGEEVITELVIA